MVKRRVIQDTNNSLKGSEPDLTSIDRKLDRIISDADERKKELVELKKIINDMREELRKKDDTIRNLRDQLDYTQQYLRVNNLIIDGLPQTETEDTGKLVIKLGEMMGVGLDEKDIDISHRLPFNRNKKQHAPVIVKFVRRTVKMDFLKKKTRLKDIPSNKIVNGASGKIFIYEHLTKRNQIISTAARKLKEEGLIYDTWVRDCKIFIREMETSPVKLITSAEDLDIIKNGPGWKRISRKNYQEDV